MKGIINHGVNNFFILFLILYAGDGISFLNHNVYPQALIVLFFVSFYYMLKNKVRVIDFFKMMIPWVIYCIVSFIYFEAVRPLFFIVLPLSFYGVYVLIKSTIDLKLIFISFERIIFILARISLFFFTWQLVDASSLINIISLIDFNKGDSYNAIVYTLHHRSINAVLPQNCGFAWEPGPYACFLILSLTIYLLKTKFTFDRRVIIYFVTILSTRSSTGYICLILLIMWFSYFKGRRNLLIVIPIVSLISVLFFNNSSVLKDKISQQILVAEDDLQFYIDNPVEERTSIGRFNGFLLNLKDFEKHPFLGHGGNFVTTFSEVNDLKITSTSGLGNWLAQYGIVGFIFLLVSFYRSSFLIVNSFKIRGSIFLFSIYITMCFSFNLIDRTMLILFFFTFLFMDLNRKKVRNEI